MTNPFTVYLDVIKMNLFKTVAGQDVSFESANELKLELQTDVSTKEVTAYLIEYNDNLYQVSEKTYNAVKDLKEAFRNLLFQSFVFVCINT